MLKRTIILLLFISNSLFAQRHPDVTGDVPDWFSDAKFGIFIHWGIYGVDGNGASWPVFNGKVTQAEYDSQLKGFNAENFDAKEWATLFKESGAKYSVLTTKHHDGVALWDTKASKRNVVKQTPAKRDLVAEYAEAIKGEGLKLGFYFSWLDWSNEDYGALGKLKKTDKHKKVPSNPKAWQRFLDFNTAQLKEISSFKPDLLWFDGDWGIEDEQWKMEEMRAKLDLWNPGVVINNRMGNFGDYETPEQGIPFSEIKNPWELCMTMSPGWGYSEQVQKNQHTHIEAPQLVQLLTECSTMGGNLLLNVSPMPNGEIPMWQQDNLRAIGSWLKVNGEAIYGSTAGIHKNHYAGPNTLSKDKKTLYLIVHQKPVNGLLVKGLRNKATSITILGDTEQRELTFKNAGGAPWLKIPPTRFLSFPDDIEIGYGRVVKLEFDEPIDLYTGHSGAIEQND